MVTEFVTRRAALKLSSAIAFAWGSPITLPQEPLPLTIRGYGRDPDLLHRPVPWPRTMTSSELAALAVLCEIILPAEPPHPSAAEVGVQNFLDEWVSAPYPQMQVDRLLILRGLALLDEDARAKVGLPFSAAGLSHQVAAFDACCSPRSPSEEFARKLIQLVCGGYYTTREGHAAIGYVGNVALASFPGAPAEVIRHFQEALSRL